jgi:hypothetical protein
MMIDVDWVYREFLRRGYRQDYAADFLDQAWRNSGKEVETHQRTEPDVPPTRMDIIRECWDAIDAKIVRGEIADQRKHEWRNGMVLASNILAEMMGWPKAKYAEECSPAAPQRLGKEE